jgi:hypothetical protein
LKVALNTITPNPQLVESGIKHDNS